MKRRGRFRIGLHHCAFVLMLMGAHLGLVGTIILLGGYKPSVLGMSGPLSVLAASAPIAILALIVGGLHVAAGVVALWWSREFVPKGAVHFVTSADEARAVLHLSDQEKEYYLSIGRHEPALIFALLAIGICSVFGLWPDDHAWVYWLAVTVFLVAFVRRLVELRRLQVAFLGATTYAVDAGIAAQNLNQPYYKFLWMARHYREAIAELDSSSAEGAE